MKKTYALKSCPWCNHTGRFKMNCDNPTWICYIYCPNHSCCVQPKTKYCAVRKTQREDENKIQKKVQKVVDLWNSGKLGFNNEGFELDFSEIVSSFLSNKIGLPGYMQNENTKT